MNIENKFNSLIRKYGRNNFEKALNDLGFELAAPETFLKKVESIYDMQFRRICNKCKKVISTQHKYIRTDNGYEHRNCDNPESYT